MSFVKEFNRVQRKAFETSVKKGFHDVDTLFGSNEDFALARAGLRLALMHSELSEALEALRHGNPPDSHIPKFTGLEAELADLVIRAMDLAEATNSRLGKAIVAKMAYNARRDRMHGGKKF